MFAAPESSSDYFEQLDAFLRSTLGDQVRDHYDIINADPAAVARHMKKMLKAVRKQRIDGQESFSFNWGLSIEEGLQHPFHATHADMARLDLRADHPPHRLASILRQTFSGIVTGNVKEYGIRAIAEQGPYQIRGQEGLIHELDGLLRGFVDNGRMKLDQRDYVPCYELLTDE